MQGKNSDGSDRISLKRKGQKKDKKDRKQTKREAKEFITKYKIAWSYQKPYKYTFSKDNGEKL